MTNKKRVIATVLFTTAISAASTQSSAGLFTDAANTVIATTNTAVSTVNAAVATALDFLYTNLIASAATLDNTVGQLPDPLACAAAYSALVNAANTQLSVDLQLCATAHVSTTDPATLVNCTTQAVTVSAAAIGAAQTATQTCLASHFNP